MKFSEFKKWFESMNKETKEFQDVFELVNDSYWNLPEDKLDDYAKAAKLLNMVSTRAEPELIIAIAKVAEEIFKVVELKLKAGHAALKVNEDSEMLFVDIYTDQKQLESLHKMLRNTVMVEANK